MIRRERELLGASEHDRSPWRTLAGEAYHLLAVVDSRDSRTGSQGVAQ